MRQTFAVGIGGAAGQGVATPGDIFAKIFSRRGLHLNAYNAYQSIIRGGHTFLTIRTGPEKVTNMGDRLDLLIPLNQDAMNRHLALLSSGAACVYNVDTIKSGAAAKGVQLCPLPVSTLADVTRNKVAQNTLAVGKVTLCQHGSATARPERTPPARRRLGKVQIEAVYFLCTSVPHQKRRVIRSQAYPGFPGIETARHFLETKKTFYVSIRNIHANEVVAFIEIVLRI